MFWNGKICILMKKFAKYVHLDLFFAVLGGGGSELYSLRTGPHLIGFFLLTPFLNHLLFIFLYPSWILILWCIGDCILRICTFGRHMISDICVEYRQIKTPNFQAFWLWRQHLYIWWSMLMGYVKTNIFNAINWWSTFTTSILFANFRYQNWYLNIF